MSTTPPGAVATAPRTAPSDGSLLARIVGVILRPRRTLREISAAPRWVGVLLVAAGAGVLAGTLLMETEVGQQALVDQWERTAAAFGHDVDDAQYARLEALSAQDGPAYAAGTAILQGPGLTLLAAVVLFLIDAKPRGVQFRRVFAVAAHAGVLLALRQVVAAPLSYIRETTASATSLGVWFPLFDEASPLARILASLDVFVIWWAVVLAIGMAVMTGRPARRYATAFLGAYAGLAILLAIVMALTGGTA